MKAATIAAHLRASGLPVVSYSEGDEALDGEVVIDDVLSVQVPMFVGQPLCINEWVDGGEAMAHHETTLAALAPKLRRMLAARA